MICSLCVAEGALHFCFWILPIINVPFALLQVSFISVLDIPSTRDVFYVRRTVDLMNTAKVNAYILHIFEKIELLSIHAT